MFMNKKTVVLGLSGGVDSAVSAFLLKQQGFNVVALFMKNWDTVLNNDVLGHYANELDGCQSNADYFDAKKVADFLDIQLHKVDFTKQYWENVFSYFISEYKKSRTPNPDVLCNKYIKFDAFMNYAIDNFGCDYIAMGHYANVKTINDQYFLQKAKDENKDQTYFLSWLNQKQLKKTIFPIGNLTKSEVRQIAKENNIPNWSKKDSTGICFIGERRFQKFLENYIPNSPGDIIDIDTNIKIGDHIGTMYYTIGQNKNLGLSGLSQKYFVCKKDIDNKIIYVTLQENKDKYLLSNCCIVSNMNWINESSQSVLNDIYVRFRHRQTLIKVNKIEKLESNLHKIYYDDALMVTPGQFAVLYKDDICIGGSIIENVEKE